MAGYQRYLEEEDPQEREDGIDTSTNYTTDQPHEVPLNFLLDYDPGDAQVSECFG